MPSLFVKSGKNINKQALKQIGTLAFLVIVCIIFSILSPQFLEANNLSNIAVSACVNAVIAVGMTLVIITAGIDLSVGSVLAMASVVMATFMKSGMPVFFAVLLALFVGCFLGIVNGALIAYAELQPFLVTLGTMSLIRGFALIYTNGEPITDLPSNFRSSIAGNAASFPIPILIALVFAVIGHIILQHTRTGEYIFSIGGNETATRFSGINVNKYKIITYALSGIAAALAGIILAARLGAAEPTAGQNYETNAIAAAAIGGASLSGGKGSILGTIIGALILSALTNGLTLLNVQSFWQQVATGAIIIIAVMVDKIGDNKKI